MNIFRYNFIRMGLLLMTICFTGCLFTSEDSTGQIEKNNQGLKIQWKDNLLNIEGVDLPGQKLSIFYIEAFCKKGSTNRSWDQTIIPHKTELLDTEENGKHFRLRTIVQSDIEVIHDIRAGKDEVDFNLVLRNNSDKAVDIEWFQPCIYVNEFTNRKQDNYIARCFIYTDAGLTTLDKTRRTEDALYKGGQTYMPSGINRDDVNPRPISLDQPVNGLIGCFSGDNKYLMATAWDHYQELFQGIYVCIHSDPRIGGLKAGEVKKLKGKLYFMKNNPEELLKRYKRDFNL